ncbi:M81 family metallopeptidase [Amphibacillus sp. Q70]|uniref:M81 family metallopeptidase n=1 Tax=Amphibacillus sp. Q70 TaxID=3453416 RepID=UPI003F84B011
MKILMASFTLESNENVPGYNQLDKFNLQFNDGVLESMFVKEIFKKANIEMIPSILADGHSGKILSKEAFNYIYEVIIRSVKENLSKLDGIFLFLHGASKIEKLNGGSGERTILNGIREVVGPYLPIAVVMDPHGNLTEEYVNNMTIARCFRESPHTDIEDTYIFVAEKFVELLNNKRHIQPVYRKLPFVLGGERSVSTDEPMLTINKKLDDIEQDNRIMSASFHVGYLRHDNFSTGSGLIVVPTDMRYLDYANEVIDELEKFIVTKYDEFQYHGNALEENKAIEYSIKSNDEYVVVTDSGDNVTSGALGSDTQLLKKYLELDNYNNKQILFAAITDSPVFYQLIKLADGDEIKISLGIEIDKFTQSVELEVTKKNDGILQESYGDTTNHGQTVTVKINDKPIDLVIIEKSTSFTNYYQFKAANINLKDYDLVVVKQGYIFPDLKEFADYSIMALTDGATNQATERIEFKQIKRPMMPFDILDQEEYE